MPADGGMLSWIAALADLASRNILVTALVMIATLVGSFAVALAVIVRLPPDSLLHRHGNPDPPEPRGFRYWAAKIAKNVVGTVLVLLGMVLSLPAIPGQGLLTIFAGILLLDFPGRRALLRKLLHRPALLASINRLRARFSRPPLVVD
jgi:hypothetical protein